MAADRVNECILKAGFPQELRRLDAVLLRELLKVHVVHQTDHRPEIRLVAVAFLDGKPAHDAFHRVSVLQMERLTVVLFQQGKRGLS